MVWGLACGVVAVGCGPVAAPGTTDAASSTSGTTTPGTSPGTTTSTTGDPAAPTMATTTTSGACDTGDCNSSAVDSSGGCSFLNCDDHGSTCSVSVEGLTLRCTPCNVFVQDCPDGFKCTAVAIDGGGVPSATQCVEVTGTDLPGDECSAEGGTSGADSCVKGAMCWGVDDMNIGTCVALCTGTPDAPVCADGLICAISNQGVLNLCLPPCDPLLQDCPDPADGCYPNDGDFVCAPDASGEQGQANDDCAFINTCDRGLMCADPASVGAGCSPRAPGCCTPFCAFPDGACPNPDQQCVQFFDPAELPEDDPRLAIGVCGLPPAPPFTDSSST